MLITGLTLLLVAAKLFGFAHYGWLVAFSPIIVSVGVTVILAGCAAIFAALVAAF